MIHSEALADTTKEGILNLVGQEAKLIAPEITKIIMPSHHDVRANDVDLKRLRSTLAFAHKKELKDFESLLLMEGIQSLPLSSRQLKTLL